MRPNDFDGGDLTDDERDEIDAAEQRDAETCQACLKLATTTARLFDRDVPLCAACKVEYVENADEDITVEIPEQSMAELVEESR